VTKRDRYILMGVGAVALIAAFWLLALAPKRSRLAKVDKDLSAAKQSLTQSQQEKVQFARAQVEFPSLYASLARLGKAVPANDDVPSLLVQLNHAAARAKVDFRSIELKLDLVDKLGAGGASAAASAAAPAAGATGATGAQGTTGAAGAAATTGAPAAGATAGAVPAATLQQLPFQYKFKGDFFHLETLIHNVTELVRSSNRQLAISGRLVVIQGFSMKRSKVTILATTYMLPADQGLFAGATPNGPAGLTAGTPQPASATGTSTTTPPTAAVTTP
jgi:hypothetical protein